ncbi:MAG: hypothetical protein U1E76_07605 [Planctomycetota bacterium]
MAGLLGRAAERARDAIEQVQAALAADAPPPGAPSSLPPVSKRARDLARGLQELADAGLAAHLPEDVQRQLAQLPARAGDLGLTAEQRTALARALAQALGKLQTAQPIRKPAPAMLAQLDRFTPHECDERCAAGG